MLAEELRARLDDGDVNRAELAREHGITRARVTQLLALLSLPTEVLAWIRECGEHEPVSGEPATAPAGARAELEAMRRAHLVAETNVKMIGALALLAACVQMVIAIVMLPKKPEATAIQMAVAGAIAACGVWLLQLHPRGRLVYTALSVIGLCGLLLRFLESGLRSPHPTHLAGAVLFSCLFLFLLWSEK